MILELVEFNSPQGWTREQVAEDARHVIAKWQSNRELVRKHFFLGLGKDDGIGGGLYLWPSIEAARKAHNAEWEAAVVKRTGGKPSIRYFDLFLLIDNVNGEVTEYDADGRARVLESA